VRAWFQRLLKSIACMRHVPYVRKYQVYCWIFFLKNVLVGLCIQMHVNCCHFIIDVYKYYEMLWLAPYFNKKLSYRRGTAPCTMTVEILSKCRTAVRKITFERLPVENDLKGDSRSSALPLFDSRYEFTNHPQNPVDYFLYTEANRLPKFPEEVFKKSWWHMQVRRMINSVKAVREL